jgi:hypothetical protein
MRHERCEIFVYPRGFWIEEDMLDEWVGCIGYGMVGYDRFG